MHLRVCLAASVLGYERGGGHLWAYLNWALGLQRLGCEGVWLEQAPDTPAEPREPVRAELFLRKDDAVGYWEGEPEPR